MFHSIKKRLLAIFSIASCLLSSASFASPALAQTAEQVNQANTLTDAQSIAITQAANQADIDTAKLAKAKTANPAVKAFADEMITEHSSAEKQVDSVAKKLKLKPEQNPTSHALKTEEKKNLATLSKIKGADFDRTYIDHEVKFHQDLLNSIDRTLLPNAKNQDVKTLLEQMRPVVSAHLQHAQRIQSELAQTSATS